MHSVLTHPPPEQEARVLHHGDLAIDLHAYRVSYRGKPVKMGYREFHLLCALARDPERVHTREELLALVWPPGAKIRLSTVNTYILRVRISLGRRTGNKLIETVRDVGYRMR